MIYHAGDLNWWHWEGEPKSYNEQMRADYQKAIGELPDQPIDVAFVPADLRLGEQYVWGLDYFMRHTDTKNVFPMHFWGSYEVFDRLFHEPCTTEYRSRIREIQTEGQVFDIPRVRHSIMKNSVSKTDNRGCMRRKAADGKSGLRRAGCRITSGGGDSKASATEINRLYFVQVEGGKAVKDYRPSGNRRGTCKPHPKQDRIKAMRLPVAL